MERGDITDIPIYLGILIYFAFVALGFAIAALLS